MKPILKIKIAVDAAMTVALLLLMAYGLVGEAAHEWIVWECSLCSWHTMF